MDTITFLWQPIFSEDPRKDLEELFGTPICAIRKEKGKTIITEQESRNIRFTFYHLIVTSYFFKKQSQKTGRPSEVTPKKLSKLLCHLSEWSTIEESAPLCGFSASAFYRFQRKNPEFCHTIAHFEKEQLPIFVARMNLILLLQKWDKKATFYVLERYDPLYRKGKYVRKPRRLAIKRKS